MTTPLDRPGRKREQRERATQNELVPAFPEIRSHPMCRLCGLVTSDPTMLRRIHTLWQDGQGVRALETATRPWWVERGETPLDHRCFHRHFRSHVDFGNGTMADDDEDDERPFEGLPVPKVELVQPRLEDEEAGASDYFDMENAIRRLRARFEQVDETVAFVDKNGRVNSYGAMLWLKLIAELRTSLETLHRMRNSDRLMRAMLQAHTKRLSTMLSRPLIERFEEVLLALRSGDAEEATRALERLAQGDIRSIVLHAAGEAVKESIDVYKLQ